MRIDTGDTAWVLVSAALVMFMTPGLALFYGGLVRAKNVLGTVMQSLIARGVIGDFRAPDVQVSTVARSRLESLLSDLTNLKSRLDAVRTAA